MPRSLRNVTLMFGLPAILVIGTLMYYSMTAQYVSTDNAYVKQDKVSVSAEVGGRIVDVNVKENWPVKKGALLFRIDPEPYQLAVAEAQAQLGTAQAHLEELEAAAASAQLEITRAEEEIRYFQNELRRQQALLKTNVTSEASLQAAEHNLTKVKADIAAARAEAAEANAAIATGKSAVKNARVQLEKANLNLTRTEVYSPGRGIVSQADRLQVGQLMLQSFPAVTIVDNHINWVEANFKETDLQNMKVGQPAEVSVDTYPDIRLQGRVESIGAGTGSEFSILPAQNTSANWVKVTQRVPVRIAILDKPATPLISGLSVHVRIDTSE